MDTILTMQAPTSVRSFQLPRYAQLPNVGLYLEQTTKYINGLLAPLDCPEITSSMISNYVKKGLIPKPVKKQYFAEHLSYLLFVAVVKQLISMDDILLLIRIQNASYGLEAAYDYFCCEFENAIYFLFGMKETMEAYGETESEEKELLKGLLYSAAHLIYMHARLEAYRDKLDAET